MEASCRTCCGSWCGDKQKYGTEASHGAARHPGRETRRPFQAMVTSERIKARAHELGFELCGIAAAADYDELSFLDTWIARRRYGTMTWLPRTARVRRDVRR